MKSEKSPFSLRKLFNQIIKLELKPLLLFSHKVIDKIYNYKTKKWEHFDIKNNLHKKYKVFFEDKKISQRNVKVSHYVMHNEKITEDDIELDRSGCITNFEQLSKKILKQTKLLKVSDLDLLVFAKGKSFPRRKDTTISITDGENFAENTELETRINQEKLLLEENLKLFQDRMKGIVNEKGINGKNCC